MMKKEHVSWYHLIKKIYHLKNYKTLSCEFMSFSFKYEKCHLKNGKKMIMYWRVLFANLRLSLVLIMCLVFEHYRAWLFL